LLARARAAMLTNYSDVARYVGLEPYVMLGRAGLHPNALSDPENWIPADRVLRLLEDSATQAHRDDFGVLLGDSRTFASIGPVSLLMKHELTLGHAIRAAIEYRRLLNELLFLDVRENGSSAIVEWGLIPGLRSAQGINLLATIAYRVIVDGAGYEWQPDCIHFRHGPPEYVATFRRVFRCPIEFDAAIDGISFQSDCLALSNETADQELAAHARRLLYLMPGVRLEDTVSERVAAIIPLLIGSGQANVEGAAACVGLPPRTLQRRLVAEGHSFSQMLNEARRDLAVRYIGNSSQSITAVAQQLGYSAQSSFTRWFISEFGMAPAKWRRLMRRRDVAHVRPGPPEAALSAA